MLSGIEVLILATGTERPIARCLSGLSRQVRRPAAITIIEDKGQARRWLAGRKERQDGLHAPWVLVLDAADLVTERALLELERLTDTQSGDYVELALRPMAAALVVPRKLGPGGLQAASRWLARRNWEGLDELLIGSLERGADVALAAAWSNANPPGGALVSELLVAGVGQQSTPLTDPEAFSDLLVAPQTDLTIVVVGGIPSHWPASLPFVPTLVTRTWSAIPSALGAVRTSGVLISGASLASHIDVTFLTKLAIRRRSGSETVILSPLLDPTLPDWQTLRPLPAEEITIAGICCDMIDVRSALLASQGMLGSLEHSVVTRLVSMGVARGPSRCAFNGIRLTSPGSLEASSDVHGPKVPLGASLTVVPELPRRTRSGPGWVPRYALSIDLAADPSRPDSLTLVSSLAPLPHDEFPLRVTIGSVERYPFPGSFTLSRQQHADRFDIRLGPVTGDLQGSAVLGYVVSTPLVDMEPLYDRWVAGRNALARISGLRLPEWPPAGTHGAAVHRVPSELDACLGSDSCSTVVIEAGGRCFVSHHPDALAVATQEGFSARIGPRLGLSPRLDSIAVHCIDGAVGYGRRFRLAGDVGVAEETDRWWGQAPPLNLRYLFEWRSRAQQRLTLGGPPMVWRCGRLVRDHRAELVGALGGVSAPGSGDQPLFEIYHPRTGHWSYTSDPASTERSGYCIVGTVAETIRVRSSQGVSLFRWHDRWSGRPVVGLVPPRSGGEPLWGWVEPVDIPIGPHAITGEAESASATSVRPVPGGRPVVLMTGPDGSTVRTQNFGALLRAGFHCQAVVGFRSPEQDELSMLRRALADRRRTPMTLTGGGPLLNRARALLTDSARTMRAW
ncbi:MAG: hypothetical protein ACKV2O_21160 [Acidimicrobiales bacterium]